MIFTIILSVLVTLIANSAIEWFVHDKLMHKWEMLPHAFHHIEYPAENWQNYEHDGSNITLPLWSGFVTVGIIGLFAILVSFLVQNWLIASCAIGVSILYFWVYSRIHISYHMPKGNWFEKTKFYKHMVRYHEIHHTNPDWDNPKNICVVFPLADFITGTGISPKK